jgi:hypothetical protein
VSFVINEAGELVVTIKVGDAVSTKNLGKVAGATGAKGDKGDKGDVYIPNYETGFFDIYSYNEEGKLEKVGQSEIEIFTGAGINAVLDNDVLYLKGIEGGAGEDGVVILDRYAKVASLVFQPDFYLEGIEGFEINTFNYVAKKLYPVTANLAPKAAENTEEWESTDATIAKEGKIYDYSNDHVGAVGIDKGAWTELYEFDKEKFTATENPDANVVRKSTAPDFIATYHVNPSNARIQTDADKFSFRALDRQYRQVRAADYSLFNVTSVKLDEKDPGLFYVHAAVNAADKIKNLGYTQADDNPDEEFNDTQTVVALQYEQGDSVVTSDYAAVVKSEYDNVILNCHPIVPNNTQRHADGDNHLYQHAKAAILAAKEAKEVDTWGKDAGGDRYPWIELLWNDDEGIDLRHYVNIHVVKDGECKYWNVYGDDGKAEANGFEYKFELVGYVLTEDGKVVNTSQSVHAAIKETEDGKWMMRAQLPATDGKQQAYGYDESKPNNLQNLATVGRMPLVRAQLLDKNNNNAIVAAGYMIVKIVAEKTEEPDLGGKLGLTTSINDKFTVTCEKNSIENYVEWYELETKVIAKVFGENDGMTRNQFEYNYVIDGNYTDGDYKDDAYQFDVKPADAKDGDDVEGTKVADDKRIGHVKVITEANPNGTYTQKLSWKVSNQEAYKLLKGKKVPTTLTTWVRYKVNPARTAGSKDYVGKLKYEYIYVKFEWTPAEINDSPSAAFAYDNRIMRYWYNGNDANACVESDPLENRNTIHGNVEVVGTTTEEAAMTAFGTTIKPKTAKADDEYVFDIKNTIVGNTMKNLVKKGEGYDGVTLDEVPTVIFIGGTVYNGTTEQKLYPNYEWSADKKTRTIVGDELHTVDWTDGTKTSPYVTDPADEKCTLIAKLDPETGAIQYIESKVAKEMLNRWGHKSLKETVTAHLQVKAEFCLPVEIENSDFKVKFLRPVDVENGTADFEDAETAGSVSPISFDLVDWRAHSFTKKEDFDKRKGFSYFEYYGQKLEHKIMQVWVDVHNAKTNINGGMKYLYKHVKAVDGFDDDGITERLKFYYLKPGTNLDDLKTTPPTASEANPQDIVETAGTKTKDGSADYGYMYYANNGFTVDNFVVEFPAIVYYDWGTISCTVRSTIGRTQDNARRR